MDTEIVKEDLRKWFKDGGWNRYNTKGEKVGKCAREDKDGDGKADGPKPKCLPASKAASLGKKKVAAAVKRKRAEDPNPDRTGAAKNVKTESIEHIKEFVGTAIAGTAGAATAKKGDKARKAVGTGAGYAVGSTLGQIAGKAIGSAVAPGANIPLIGGAAKAMGQAAGSGIGGVAGGVGGAVAGNKLAGTSGKERAEVSKKKQKAQNMGEEVTFQQFMEKCWKGYEKKGMKTMFGKRYPNCVKKEETDVSVDECWKTHKKVGMKMKGGKLVNDCRPKTASDYKKEEVEVEEGAAWTKKSGKNESGGLNEKGRKSYERENPGSDLKAPSKKVGNPRRASFCARMKGMKKKLTSKKTANDPDSRINKSLRAWNC